MVLTKEVRQGQDLSGPDDGLYETLPDGVGWGEVRANASMNPVLLGYFFPNEMSIVPCGVNVFINHSGIQYGDRTYSKQHKS